ncbi:hypothetical protein P7C70_g6714, partial [Phenoliferia sp. Uapishka_3]
MDSTGQQRVTSSDTPGSPSMPELIAEQQSIRIPQVFAASDFVSVGLRSFTRHANGTITHHGHDAPEEPSPNTPAPGYGPLAPKDLSVPQEVEAPIIEASGGASSVVRRRPPVAVGAGESPSRVEQSDDRSAGALSKNRRGCGRMTILPTTTPAALWSSFPPFGRPNVTHDRRNAPASPPPTGTWVQIRERRNWEGFLHSTFDDPLVRRVWVEFESNGELAPEWLSDPLGTYLSREGAREAEAAALIVSARRATLRSSSSSS